MDKRLDDLKAIHRDIGEVVSQQARSLVPHRTGRLGRSIKAAARAKSLTVSAGSRIPPYAGPIHFGWRARNIEPQPFLYDALDDRRDEVRQRYDDGIGDLVKRFDREAP